MGNSSAHDFFLHRASADWGEGDSDAGSAGGSGGDSAPGDATWEHTFFDTEFWTSEGGDFAASPSASQSVGPGLGSITFTGPGLTADVQAWLDAPADDFGWFLLGDETGQGTARRFDSRHHATPGVRPLLEIEYSAPTPLPLLPSEALPLAGLLIWLAAGRVLCSRRRRGDAGD